MKIKPGFHGCFMPPKPPKDSVCATCALEFWCTQGKDRTKCKDYEERSDKKR